MGAGVIPLAVNDDEVLFLFQHSFSGRKVGHLIDFGGGLGDGEGYRATAVREFVEETETMYLTLADDLTVACRSEQRVLEQVERVDALFERTLSRHPRWWRRRAPGNPERPKDWRSYFIEFPFRDVAALNHEWLADSSGRFKKRRALEWVSADRLLDIYARSPEQLWKRVRQLEDAPALIREIQASLLDR